MQVLLARFRAKPPFSDCSPVPDNIPDTKHAEVCLDAPEGYTPEGYVPEGYAPEGYVPEGYAPEGNAPEGNAPFSSLTSNFVITKCYLNQIQ